jgi:LmbE family N-acetylglucosaminyl deacetylase
VKFNQVTADVFIPDRTVEAIALNRTSHLAISAHQDDIEIMAAGPILQCYQKNDLWFTGVVVTDGRGSPRNGIYEKYTDDEMYQVRRVEQMKAASLGEYAAQILLDYPSTAVKAPENQSVVEDLVSILVATRPQHVYTHNLADKHDTHVATALRVIQAVRLLDPADRPQTLIGCEVWRDLDWMLDSDKEVFYL